MTMLTNMPNSVAAVPIGQNFAAQLGKMINNWLADWIARKEREAARKLLFGFSDRQLNDIGIARSQIDHIVNQSFTRN